MESAKKCVAIIGAGKVGSALALGLRAAGYPIGGVVSRSSESASRLAAAVGARVSNTLDGVFVGARTIIIATPDREIAAVGRALAVLDALTPGHVVLHTSGTLPSDVLHPVRHRGAPVGGLHPMQSFARYGDVERLKGCHFGIEGDAPAEARAGEIARAVGGHVLLLGDGDKDLYHAAACVASNYLVVILHLARTLMERSGVDAEQGYRALLGLVRGTLANLEGLEPGRALTGPIARGDVLTLARHLDAIGVSDPAAAALYRQLARYATGLARDTGRLDAMQVMEILNVMKGDRANDYSQGDHDLPAADEAERAADYRAHGLRLPSGADGGQRGH